MFYETSTQSKLFVKHDRKGNIAVSDEKFTFVPALTDSYGKDPFSPSRDY
jgi:hypothetical protein